MLGSRFPGVTAQRELPLTRLHCRNLSIKILQINLEMRRCALEHARQEAPSEMLTRVQQHALDRFAKSLLTDDCIKACE